MIKKVTLLCGLLMAASSMLLAQSQQGYVKTKGRLVNGKYYEGQRIPQATIQVKNLTAVLSKKDGSFSFPTTGKNYTLQQVEKKGYVLLDQDVLYRQFAYSTNPLVLVMEDKAQLEADRRAIERQVRRVTDEELQRRGEKIEALKEQNKITDERYRELLQKLNNDYDQNEQLIKEMVDQYNKIDFDQMDEFNRRVSDCIINGRLDEADSLLHTKGNIDEQIDNLNKHHKANVEARSSLEKSEVMEEYNRKNIAQLCYNKFLVFKMRHQYDSAAYYIEKRVQLDSTKIDWLHEAADFFDNYLGNYDKSLQYYQMAFIVAEQSGDQIDIARANDNIGTLLTNYDKGEEGLAFTKKGQAIRKKELGEHHHDVAVGYGNIGYDFDMMEKHDSALFYFNLAIDLLKKNNDTNNSDYVRLYQNMANAIYNSGDINTALALFQQTSRLVSSVFPDSSITIALFYNDYGMILKDAGYFEEALQMHRKTLGIKTVIYGEMNSSIAASYTNIASAYSMLGEYDSALFYHQKSLAITFSIFGENNSFVADGFNNVGFAFSNLNDYQSSMENQKRALKIRKKVLGENHSKTALSYNNIGFVFMRMNQLDSALVYQQKALSIRINIFGEKHPDIAMSYTNIGAVYLYLNNYQEALLNFCKALKMYTDVFGENSFNVASPYSGLAQTYEKMGDYSKAEEYYEKTINVMGKYYPEDHPSLMNYERAARSSSREKQ